MPGRALLAELKADPGQVGLETLLREIDKLAATGCAANTRRSQPCSTTCRRVVDLPVLRRAPR